MNRESVALMFACTAMIPVSSAVGQCEFELVMPGYWHLARWEVGNQREICSDDQTLAMGCTGIEGWNPMHDLPAVMTFQYDGSSWTDEQFIVDPNSDPNSGFGLGIAVHGDRLVISAPDHAGIGGTHSGRVYVYGRQNGVWDLESILDMPITTPDGRLGRQIATNGDHIVATVDRLFTDGPLVERAAIVFEEVGPGQWEYVQLIEDPNDEPDDDFGEAIEMSGDRMIIGAPNRDVGPPPITGAVYVYDRTDGLWAHGATILPTELNESGLGRATTTIHGTTVASATNMSYLTIYELNQEDSWERTALLPALPLTGLEPTNSLDHGIDMTGDTIALTHAGGSAGGSLHIARRTKDGWINQTPVRPNHNLYGQSTQGFLARKPRLKQFGKDVCLANGRALVLSVFHTGLLDDPAPCAVSFDPTDVIGHDRNNNGVCDLQDFLDGTLGADLDLNGIEDAYEIANGLGFDCNENGVIDTIELDCDGDGLPDDCEADCNHNGIPDQCESFYDSFPEEGIQGYFYSPGEGQHMQHLTALVQFEIQPGGEVLQSVTMQNSDVYPNINARLIIYRDPDCDTDPTNAELIYECPLEFPDGNYLAGTTTTVPDVFVGEAGTCVHIGYLFSPYRPGEAMLAGSYSANAEGAYNDTWLTYWNVEPHSTEKVKYADLSSGDMQQPLRGVRANIDAHFGPRSVCCLSADFDFSGSVDVNDLLTVLAHWGPCEIQCTADTNGDMTVNVDDLLHLLSFWGACDP